MIVAASRNFAHAPRGEVGAWATRRQAVPHVRDRRVAALPTLMTT
jgi:hypothetical protein